METSSIKQSVVDSYGKLAKAQGKAGIFSKLFACCDTSAHANQVGEMIGYSKEILEEIPDGSNLGVSCGNPAAFSNIQPGEVVVDLGSGAGFDAFIVAPMVGEEGKVIGIDLSDEMLALARKNSQQGPYQQVEFHKGDIEELPLEDHIADHVISNCVINLSLRKREVFQEAFRILKSGGKLSISDIVLEKELPDFIKDSLAGHIACVAGAEKLEHYFEYLQQAGFKDIKVEKKLSFPLEYMLADPTVMKVAQAMGLTIDSEEAKELASRVKSISLTARK